MSTKRITLNLPADLYRDLEEIAEASSTSVEEVVIQTVRAGMPPTLNKVPPAFHEELLVLNKLGDRELLQVVEGKLPGKRSDDEQRRKADFEALRRTYALSLLKWRGHPIPTPYESMIE